MATRVFLFMTDPAFMPRPGGQHIAGNANYRHL
jgi:hypothetical protein